MSKPKTADPKYRYVDIPELPETFADTIHELFVDWVTFRCTFAVTRVDLPPTSGKRYPACRLVLTLEAAHDLYGKLSQIKAAFEQVRKMQQAQKGPVTVQ